MPAGSILNDPTAAFDGSLSFPVVDPGVTVAADANLRMTLDDLKDGILTNVPTPTSAGDAATKAYADGAGGVASVVSNTGTVTLANLVAGGVAPSASPTLTGTAHVGNIIGGAGTVDLTSSTEVKVPAPASGSDAATKTYVDAAAAAGGVITSVLGNTGSISLAQLVTGGVAPSASPTLTGTAHVAGVIGGAGTVDLTSSTEVKVPTPTNSSDAATKAYVDAAINGLQIKQTATVATAAALPTNTYSSGVITVTATGTLTVDGHLTALGDLILVKDEVSALKNGLYSVTTAGAGGVQAVLTRVADMNDPSEFSGALIPVGAGGTANANTMWIANPVGTVTVGTTAIPFVEITAPTSYTNGTNISISGNTISVSGTLAVALGGTGLGSGTSGGILGYTASGVLSSSGVLTAHGILIGGGAGATPTAVAVMTNGQLLIGATGADPAPQTVSGDGTINAGGTLAVSTINGVAPATVANTGAFINSGTVQTNKTMSPITGTVGGTVTIAPLSGYSYQVVNMPTNAGTVTFTGTPTFSGQECILDIKFGSTLSVANLGAVFVPGGGVPVYTTGTVVSAIDRLKLFSPDGTHWVYMAYAPACTL